jgi:hypothetical protein
VLRSLALLVVLMALLAGCGGGSLSVPPTSIDPVELVKILPTPQGLDQSSDVTTVDAAELQATLAGVAKSESAKVYEDIGFAGGAMRTWSGPADARVLAVVSRWPDHETATRIGGGAVNQIAEQPGVGAWTPRELASTRGAHSTTPGSGAVRVLSLAVDDLSLLVRSDGPIGDDVIIRTMDLLTRRARAAAR